MPRPEHDAETGLPDLTALSLDDLPMLDDSVVANAIKVLVARRGDCAEYGETFSNWNAAS